MSEPLPSFCVKRFLTTYLITTGFGAHGGSGNESSKEVTIQYYAAIQCYADQIKSEDEKNSFYYDGCLYDWEIAMRTNMGGGLPISGFYEMKQEVYEIYRRQSVR